MIKPLLHNFLELLITILDTYFKKLDVLGMSMSFGSISIKSAPMPVNGSANASDRPISK